MARRSSEQSLTLEAGSRPHQDREPGALSQLERRLARGELSSPSIVDSALLVRRAHLVVGQARRLGIEALPVREEVLLLRFPMRLGRLRFSWPGLLLGLGGKR